MRYERLHINHFGTLQNDTRAFSDGFNRISCAGEEGKKSLTAFLSAMLFGLDPNDPGTEEQYNRFYPRSGSSTYGGVLEFTRDETTYAMYRNFYRDPAGFTLMDETHGRQVRLSAEEYRRLIHDIPSPVYNSIISPEPILGNDPAAQRSLIRDQLTSLYHAGTIGLNTEAARERLLGERDRLASLYSEDVDRQSAHMEDQITRLTRECDLLPNASDLPAWEKECEVFRGELNGMRDKQASLDQDIRAREEYLKSYTGQMGCTFQEAEDRCLRLVERRERLLSRYPDPTGSPLQPFYPSFIVGSYLAAVLCVLFGIYAFLRSWPVPCVAAVAAAAACVGLGLRFRRKQNAAKAFLTLEHAIQRMFKDLLPTIEDPERQTLEGFLNLMKELQRKKKALQRSHLEFEMLTAEITSMTEKEQRLLNRLEAKKEEFRRKVALSERIIRMEEEYDALRPQRENNAKLAADIEVCDLAIRTLDDLSSHDFTAFADRVVQTASEHLSRMSGGTYDMLRIDDDGDVILECELIPRPLRALSAEALPMILMALRTAYLQTLWPSVRIPLILDESFLANEKAASALIPWLKENYPGQILLITT